MADTSLMGADDGGAGAGVATAEGLSLSFSGYQLT